MLSEIEGGYRLATGTRRIKAQYDSASFLPQRLNRIEARRVPRGIQSCQTGEEERKTYCDRGQAGCHQEDIYPAQGLSHRCIEEICHSDSKAEADEPAD